MNFPQTRKLSTANIKSDYDLGMITFRLRLKRAQQQTFKRMKDNLEGLKSTNLMQQFNAILGEKLHQLIDLTDTDADNLTNTFNKTISDTAAEPLWKCQNKKKQWMTDDLLAPYNERCNQKK